MPAASGTAAGARHLREERVGEGVGEAGGGGDVDADGGGDGDAGQGGLRVREGRAQQLGNEGLQSEGARVSAQAEGGMGMARWRGPLDE